MAYKINQKKKMSKLSFNDRSDILLDTLRIWKYYGH